MSSSEKIKQAAEAIQAADALLIGAGAGMGVDSGLPDFRGTQGFWKAYPIFAKKNLSFAQMANPSWFTKDPHQAWGFYGHRLNLYRATTPHAGFEILKRWTEHKESFVFTSNVDGHFKRSGFDSNCILECHGSLLHLQCNDLCHHHIWPVQDLKVTIDEEEFMAKDPLPKCPECENVARPNVLMFGDYGWISSRTSKQTKRYYEWIESLQERRIVAIEMGAGTAIPSVRHECEERSDTLIRINPREAQGSENTISVELGALAALQEIDDLVKF